MKIMGISVSGKWIITLKDNSKWVIDFDKNIFDNYKWYKKMGTLESEFNWEEFRHDIKFMKKM